MKNNNTSKGKFILKRIGFAAFATIIGGGGPITVGLLQGKCIEDASYIAFKKIDKWIEDDLSINYSKEGEL